MGKYHFIAIGGIGMSGLAKYLLEEGHTVSGSDIEDSKYINALRDLGATVYIGHDEKNLPEDATVIVSTAIRETNPELKKARNLGLKVYHRSDLLQEISASAQKQGKCFIGYSGTHGKTTTSGLSSYVLEKSGFEPAFVVGGIVPDIHTNAQHKGGKYFTAELDESDGTIVKYSSDILVINNLEEDHVDFYKNGLSDLVATFNKAISNSKKVLINADNNGCKMLNGEHITFGLNEADYVAKSISSSKDGSKFDMYYRGKYIDTIEIQLTGKHNIYNALSVAASLHISGIDISKVKEHFKTFTGMGRRFQHICSLEGIEVYDDYAHHPTEINAALDAASTKFGKENIVAVFQPHRYTRLKGLWNDFQDSFSNAKRVIVTDVYAASEDVIEGISGENFAKSMDKAEYIQGSIENVAKELLPTLKKGNVVIGLGAGTITDLGKYLQKYYGELSCK
ncbi:MAG: UDP-N-acetylmuramate--L-alanine ligase [bacterium]|nr:UDP-N-acetylmuramate--L-alanine ligase [bacterium]